MIRRVSLWFAIGAAVLALQGGCALLLCPDTKKGESCVPIGEGQY